MSKKQSEVMGSTGIRFTAEQLKRCDEKSSELGISRNEFIREAVEFYLEWLSRESSEKFLTPAFESVISAKLRDTEDRLSRILFKMAVEQNILTHYLMTDPNEQIFIEDLRSMAVQELKETNGTLGISNILNRTIEMLLSLQESVVENRAISYAVGDTICGSERFKAYVDKAKESINNG